MKNVYIGPNDVRGSLDVELTNTGAGAAAYGVWSAQEISPRSLQ